VAQQSVSKLTAEKKVETKKINPTASLVRCVSQYNIQKRDWDAVLVVQNDGRFLLLLKGDAVRLVSAYQSDFLPKEKSSSLCPTVVKQLSLIFSLFVPKCGSAVLGNKIQ